MAVRANGTFSEDSCRNIVRKSNGSSHSHSYSAIAGYFYLYSVIFQTRDGEYGSVSSGNWQYLVSSESAIVSSRRSVGVS